MNRICFLTRNYRGLANAGIKQLDKSRTYYIYCRSGKRSHGACLKMKKQGFKVYDMEGGILNWTKLGMPVER